MPTLRRWVREPLVRFILLGLIVFAVDRWSTEATSQTSVFVTDAQVARLAALWERQWRRPPTDAELEGLLADHVREEVLYREALRLGLDEDDTIIRRRLAQKLAFLAEDRALPESPPEEDLRAWFDAHRERYARPARWSLRQIPFTAARSDAELEAEVAQARAALARNTDDTSGLGDASMLPRRVDGWTPRELAAEFGGGFAKAVEALPSGEWAGPLPSAFGVHLVRVEDREPARVPSFEEARREVGRDWLDAARTKANAGYYAELLDRYRVRFETEGLSLPAPTR